CLARLETAVGIEPLETPTAEPIPLFGGGSIVIDGGHFGSHRQRQPEARTSAANSGETARHHTDHHEGFVVQPQRLTDDVRVFAEARLPQLVAYDYNRFPARRADFFRRECATANGADAEDREVIVGNELSRNLLHFCRGGLTSQEEFLVGAGHKAGD